MLISLYILAGITGIAVVLYSLHRLGVFTEEGEWLIEGHGVDPDMVVDNLPHETFLGRDRQLEAAIDYLEKKIETEPITIPEPPPYYRRPDAPLLVPHVEIEPAAEAVPAAAVP